MATKRSGYQTLKKRHEELEAELAQLRAERDAAVAEAQAVKTVTWSARIPVTLRDELKALDPGKTVQQITLDALNAYLEAHRTDDAE